MNLCYVDCDKPNDNGLSTYTHELLKEYQLQKGLQLCCIWTNSTRYNTIHKEVIDRVYHIYVPINLRSKGRNYESECADIIAEYAQDKTDLIVHFNWINHCSIAWLLKQRIKVLTILTKHCIPWRDLITNDYPQFCEINSIFESGLPLKTNNLQLKREQIYYDCIDHIIAVTQFAKKSLTQLFKLPPNKITVVKNGLTTAKTRKVTGSGQAKLRSKYGFSMNEKIILYAGNVNQRKGVHDLLSAFERLSSKEEFNHVRLVIAGPGNYNEAIKVVKKQWSKITLTGALDKDTLRDFYKMADVGVIPSYIEQCSYTAIEMMLCQLPVLVSDTDGLKEMVNHECGLKLKVLLKDDFASIDQHDLIEKMAYLLNQPYQAARYARNARKFAEEHFTANRMAEETVGIYKLLLKGQADNSVESRQTLNPLVSIILPCYNAEVYLKSCLTSILTQTYTNFELIIVDDGSTDMTENIINEIKDLRVIHIKNAQNLGIAACLNKAISKAKGKYIARIDADDLMLQDRLELQVNFLENNPDYGLVGSAYNIIDKNGMPLNRIEPINTNKELKLSMLFFNPFAHPTVMISAEVFKTMMYDESYECCEDYELWFRIAERYKIANLSQILLDYRVHDQNTSVKNNKLMKQNVITLLSRELDKLGIEHSAEELMIHSAISFGYASTYFNTVEKVTSLKQWLNKLFSSKILRKQYSPEIIGELRKQITKSI